MTIRKFNAVLGLVAMSLARYLAHRGMSMKRAAQQRHAADGATHRR